LERETKGNHSFKQEEKSKNNILKKKIGLLSIASRKSLIKSKKDADHAGVLRYTEKRGRLTAAYYGS